MRLKLGKSDVWWCPSLTLRVLIVRGKPHGRHFKKSSRRSCAGAPMFGIPLPAGKFRGFRPSSANSSPFPEDRPFGWEGRQLETALDTRILGWVDCSYLSAPFHDAKKTLEGETYAWLA